ncbi:hypothetical protein [Bacillus phage Hyb3phi3Ts-SPbeta]|nr:hypothetical protein [Bacillus phage Hyb3phi3Ts-SPbeta]
MRTTGKATCTLCHKELMLLKVAELEVMEEIVDLPSFRFSSSTPG